MVTKSVDIRWAEVTGNDRDRFMQELTGSEIQRETRRRMLGKVTKAGHESGFSPGTHECTRGNTHGSCDPRVWVTRVHRSLRIRV